MTVLVQIAVVLTAVAILAALVVSVIFYRSPIATIVWFRRQRLGHAGLARMTVQTSVGPQMVWCGGRGPLLIVLHGAGDQAGTWHRIAPRLARRYSLVLPDLSGHGQSAPSAGRLSVGTILGTLEQVLDTTTWKSQRFILAGNSLGAWIAMLYARKHPARVSRLFVINGGALKHEQNEITLMPKNREEAGRAFDAILDPATRRPAAFVLDDLVRIASCGPIARITATAAELPDHVLDGKLSDFPVPVDIVWGASDRLVPLDYARSMAAQLPAARLTVIERCGHAPQLECPGKLAETLISLLAEEPPQNKQLVSKAPKDAESQSS